MIPVSYTHLDVYKRQPEYTMERAGKILNRYKKALNGSKVLVLGVAYKQDIDDYRESPAIRPIHREQKKRSFTIKFWISRR